MQVFICNASPSLPLSLPTPGSQFAQSLYHTLSVINQRLSTSHWYTSTIHSLSFLGDSIRCRKTWPGLCNWLALLDTPRSNRISGVYAKQSFDHYGGLLSVAVDCRDHPRARTMLVDKYWRMPTRTHTHCAPLLFQVVSNINRWVATTAPGSVIWSRTRPWLDLSHRPLAHTSCN